MPPLFPKGLRPLRLADLQRLTAGTRLRLAVYAVADARHVVRGRESLVAQTREHLDAIPRKGVVVRYDIAVHLPRTAGSELRVEHPTRFHDLHNDAERRELVG